MIPSPHQVEQPGASIADHAPSAPDLASEDFLKRGFQEFLGMCFADDTVLIAYTFDVSQQTARNWVGGSLPNAYRLWLMLQTYPEARRCLHLVVDNPPPRPALTRAVDQLRKLA